MVCVYVLTGSIHAGRICGSHTISPLRYCDEHLLIVGKYSAFLNNQERAEFIKLHNKKYVIKNPSLCLYCKSNKISIINLPCYHSICCSQCIKLFTFCFLCKEQISDIVKQN